MFSRHWILAAAFSVLLAGGARLSAQEPFEAPREAGPVATEAPAEEPLKERAEDALQDAKQQAEKIAGELDKSPEARKVTAGILQPIYRLAEHLAFPLFHWVAFTVMATGVVSYSLQLVLAKLVVLTRLGFSPAEILSDALGLVISLVGLVLTTQAAAENSSFTQSPASVLSATAVGVICGFIFYRWGQAQEVQATIARSRAAAMKS